MERKAHSVFSLTRRFIAQESFCLYRISIEGREKRYDA